MNLALTLLLGATLPSAPPTLPNLDFSTGQLTHWEGEGFSIGPADGHGPSTRLGVCSSDRGPKGKTALLYRTFTVPRNAGFLRFRAAAVLPTGKAPGGQLDVILEAAGRQVLPKYVYTASGWRPANKLLPLAERRPRDYYWPLSAHAGRTVRIALIDEDDRPGCHVLCGGFSFVEADDLNAREFANHMARLQRKHRLAPMARFDSQHFVAISNAPTSDTEYRLHNCETIYSVFYDHFRRRGFSVREPKERLMVAVFDTQAGFEAYLGGRNSSAITGVYHLASNRLLVYDYGTNRNFLARKKQTDEAARRAGNDLERSRLVTLAGRHFDERRNDVNISTVMHEVAHQLSFNGGLLNRKGDAPVWLVEGLACYCEPTVGGSWQGIGAPNPARARTLAAPARGEGKFIPLRDLVRNDDWLRRATRTDQVILGYSQSWALFSWLMRDRPRELRRYLAMIYERRTPQHRLTDFGACFGADLARQERRYQAYMREVVRQQVGER